MRTLVSKMELMPNGQLLPVSQSTFDAEAWRESTGARAVVEVKSGQGMMLFSKKVWIIGRA